MAFRFHWAGFKPARHDGKRHVMTSFSVLDMRRLFDLYSFSSLRRFFQVFSVGHGLEPISKIVDHAQEQGAGRRKSAAYIRVCEHFKEIGNAAIER